MRGAINVVVGTPIYRRGAYIIDKFLSNQKEIQQNYPSSELILATCEWDFIEELASLLNLWQLRGRVLSYKIVKPDFARSRVWNIAAGRAAIQKYMLSQGTTEYLLFLDADMTFDSSVIKIMEREIQGYDVVFSGTPLRYCGIGLAGWGFMMLTKGMLEKLQFRFYEFKNGEVIPGDQVLELDLFQLGSRVKKGFFVATSHYQSENEVKYIIPQPVGVLRRIANSLLVRYVLIKVSIIAQYNLPWKLKILLNRFLGTVQKVQS